MHFLDNLPKLTDQRLRAYRRSIMNKISAMTACDCGSQGCSGKIDGLNASDKAYLENLNAENKRISKEYWRRKNSIKISLDEQYKNSRMKV